MAHSKFITRIEAAKMLDVSPQTISNYISRGLVRRADDGTGNVIKVHLEDIEQLVPHKGEFAGWEDALEKYRAETEQAVAQERTALDALKSHIRAASVDDRKRMDYSAFLDKWVEAVCEMAGEKLSGRDAEITARLLRFESLEKICAEVSLTSDRVMCIANRVLRVVSHSIPATGLEYKNKCLRLETDLRNIQRESLSADRKPHERRIVDREMSGKLDLEIRDLGLSVRATNALSVNNILTLRDIVKYSRQELWKSRNMGRKSIEEIDSLLERHGLRYEMVAEAEATAYDCHMPEEDFFWYSMPDKELMSYTPGSLSGLSKEDCLRFIRRVLLPVSASDLTGHLRFEMSGNDGDRTGSATVLNQDILNRFAFLGIYDYTVFLALDFHEGTPSLHCVYWGTDDLVSERLDGFGTCETIHRVLERTVWSGRDKRRRTDE